MNCIGIDPAYAKPIAYAYKWKSDWVIGEVEPDKIQEFADVFRRASERGIDMAIIEDGFVGKNPQVSMKLCEVRGRLMGISAPTGLGFHLVAPATWQAAMLTQGKWKPIHHKEIIQQTMWRVRNFNGIDTTEDKAVAIVLAEWGNSQREFD